jgi:hypothetical protein
MVKIQGNTFLIKNPSFRITRSFQPSPIYENRIGILHCCITKFGKVMTRGQVDSFLIRHKDELAETISKPQEDARLQVSRELLLRTISPMEEAVQSCVRDLVFNLDEVRVSEWEDRKSKKLVVPTAMGNQTIHHGVDRNLKHSTVITWVEASGKHGVPYIIMSHESENLRETLRKKSIEFECENRFGFGRNSILKESQKAYVDSKSFAEYVKSTFISHVTRIRAERGIEQEDAMLLM